MSDFKFIHVSDLHIGREITKKYSFLNTEQETQVVVLTHDEVFAEALSKSSQDVNLIDLNNR